MRASRAKYGKGNTTYMTMFSRAVVAIAATVATLAAGGLITAAGQEPAERLAMEIRAMSATTDVSELRRLDALVDAMARTDELVPASRQADRHMLGRVHESFMQYHQGVPVHGGGVSRQPRSSARSTRGSTSTRRRGCHRTTRSPCSNAKWPPGRRPPIHRHS